MKVVIKFTMRDSQLKIMIKSRKVTITIINNKHSSTEKTITTDRDRYSHNSQTNN